MSSDDLLYSIQPIVFQHSASAFFFSNINGRCIPTLHFCCCFNITPHNFDNNNITLDIYTLQSIAIILKDYSSSPYHFSHSACISSNIYSKTHNIWGNNNGCQDSEVARYQLLSIIIVDILTTWSQDSKQFVEQFFIKHF